MSIRYMLPLLLAGAWLLPAQTEKAQLNGQVTDSTKASVPGVQIAATNAGTGLRRSVTTNERGLFTIPLLDPGTYDIVVQKDGFRTISQAGVKLDVAQVARLDFVLEIGAVSEQVSVTAETPLLDSSSSSLSHLIENKRIVELPLSGRNAYSFATLVPGVRASRGFTRVAVDMYADQFVSINGSRSNQNQFQMDGGTNTTAGFNGPGLFPSVDMVAEYKVQTNNFSAEYSETAGGVVNVVTKTGTNQFHGGLYEFVRNNIFNANDFFSNRAGREQPPFRFNQFGGTIGGPVRKNTTFFFAAYEGLRWTRGMTVQGTLPTELQRAGDFSATRNQNGAVISVYDPFTSRANPANPATFLRDVFPGNRVPAARINPVSRSLIGLTPLPNTTGNPVTAVNNYFSARSTAIGKDLFSIRGDHSISTNHRLFLRYSANDTANHRPNLYGDEHRLVTPSNGEDDYLQRQVVLNYNAILRSNLIFDASSSFLRYFIQRASPGLDYDPVQLGFPTYMRRLQPDLTPCFPGIGVSGLGVSVNIPDIGGGFLGSCAQLGNSFDTFQQSANLTWVKGSHSIKTGFAHSAKRWSARNFFLANHTYSFAPNFTQGPNPLVATATAGVGYASFLVGAGTGNIRSGGSGVNVQTVTWGSYIQDDWKVSRKLTLNLGLRYDNPRPWTERFNRVSSWCWDCSATLPVSKARVTGGLAFPGVGGGSRFLYNTDNLNFAPRIGLAYAASAQTVIRAGYGMFYGPVQGGAVNNNSTPRSGFDATTTWLSSLDSITPRNLLSDPYPDGFAPAPGSSQGLLTLLGQGVAMMDPDRQSPYAQQWNLSVQRNLPLSFVLELAYAGSRGIHLFGPMNVNQLPDDQLALGDGLRTLVNNPYFGSIDTGALAQRQVQRGQLLRPFPQFTGVTAGNSSYGASTYHSFQWKAERRFREGLSLMFSYTWSKLLDDVVASTAGAGFPGEDFGDAGLQNFFNRSSERAPAQFDAPHSFSANWIYEFPIGKGKRWGSENAVLRWVAGGWQLNGISTLRSGVPLALRTSTNTLGNNGGAQRPNYVGGDLGTSGRAQDRLDRFFNVSAFAVPAPYTYGNVARLASWLRAQSLANLDLALAKNFPITERFRMQFRFETFNTFNRPEFGLPNTAIGAPAAGVINSQVNTPRDLQFGLKLAF
ncbi:MAG: TonB-dependent receptor [Acidobacteria bacterium]|nr:TonB-dependent receptor [Acidobacteriota bacterium]